MTATEIQVAAGHFRISSRGLYFYLGRVALKERSDVFVLLERQLIRVFHN